MLNSLILLARLRQEIGEFVKADEALNEVHSILEGDSLKDQYPEAIFYFWAKYYHVQSKNFAREQYLQKASELFKKGLAFLASETKFDRVRIKFTCKLYEGLGHLLCEPLLFDRAEDLLDKAEELYDEHENLFDTLDRTKFLIKKSSFLKKYGFFSDAIDLLEAMQRDLVDELKKPLAAK